jgi:hypothetical protein
MVDRMTQEYDPPTDGSVLYKYRDLDGSSFQRVWSIIAESEVYLASARSFNDPFDMKLRYETQADEARQREYFEDLLRRKIPGLTDDQLKAEVQRALDKFSDDDAMRQAEADMQGRIYADLGVLSLSEDPGHLLMWSHYANSHRGICVGFGATDPLIERALPVTYQDEYYVIDPLSVDRDSQAENVLTTKSALWAYERERRVVDPDGPRARKLGDEAIAVVILGSRISDDQARPVISWTRTRDQTIPIVRAVESSNTYEIEFQSVS